LLIRRLLSRRLRQHRARDRNRDEKSPHRGVALPAAPNHIARSFNFVAVTIKTLMWIKVKAIARRNNKPTVSSIAMQRSS
jgi:hypothetical protein